MCVSVGTVNVLVLLNIVGTVNVCVVECKDCEFTFYI